MGVASPAGLVPVGALEVPLSPRRGCWQAVERHAPCRSSCPSNRPCLGGGAGHVAHRIRTHGDQANRGQGLQARGLLQEMRDHGTYR